MFEIQVQRQAEGIPEAVLFGGRKGPEGHGKAISRRPRASFHPKTEGYPNTGDT